MCILLSLLYTKMTTMMMRGSLRIQYHPRSRYQTHLYSSLRPILTYQFTSCSQSLVHRKNINAPTINVTYKVHKQRTLRINLLSPQPTQPLLPIPQNRISLRLRYFPNSLIHPLGLPSHRKIPLATHRVRPHHRETLQFHSFNPS